MSTVNKYEKQVSSPCISQAISMGWISKLCENIMKNFNCTISLINDTSIKANSEEQLDDFNEASVLSLFEKLTGIVDLKRDKHYLSQRTDIMMPWAFGRVGLVNAEGCKKYGRYNFMKGEMQSSLLNHAMEHLYSWTKEVINSSAKSGEDDLAKVVWNFMLILDQDQRIKEGLLPKELDDLKGEEQ